MYSFFVGCDISKASFDVSYQSAKPVYVGQFKNSLDGFKRMVRELRKTTKEPQSKWMICFENTGVYSKALLEWLISQQIGCLEENPLKIAKSRGLKRGKNDVIDSKTICRYVFEKRDSIVPTQLSKPLIVNLKKLLSRRDLLVRQKQSLLVSLQDQRQGIDPHHYLLFKKQNDKLIKLYSQQISSIEKEINRTVEEDQQVKKNYELVQSVIGIGPIIAGYMIATTNNFESFESARKFGSYSGIAPFLHNQSGKKKGVNRVSHMANKKLKSLLSNGARAAILFDPQLRLYYQRKVAEGKGKGLVFNNVKNKLVQRAFAVIKRQKAYVKLGAYA